MQMPEHEVNGYSAMVSQEKRRRDTTIDPEDVARFDRLGAQWWDKDGPMRRCTSSTRSVSPICASFWAGTFWPRTRRATGVPHRRSRA